MLVGVGNGLDGLVWTNHGAHGTADTGIGHVLFLADTYKCTVFVAAFLLEDVKFRHPLSSIGEVDGLFGANCSAVAAEGTSIFAVLDYPGQVSVA